MKGKTTIRILAWIMSVCMIVGLLPVTPGEYAAKAAAGDTVVYDFTKVANVNTASGSQFYNFFSTSNSGGAGEADAKFSTLSSYAIAENAGSAPWQLFYAYASKDCYAGFYQNLGFLMFMRSSSRGSNVRVNLKVANSGWYIVTSQLNNAYKANDGTVTYNLYKGGESSTTGTKMLTSSFVPGSGLQTLSLNDGAAVYLDKDTVYVAEIDAKGGSTSKGQYYIYNITLTETEAPAVEDPTIYDFSGKITGATADKTLWCSNTGVDEKAVYGAFTYPNAAAKGSLPWCYFDKASSNNSRNYWSMNAESVYVRSNQGRQTTVNFKIKVPETGYWELTPEYRVVLGRPIVGDVAAHSGIIQLFESDGATGIAAIEEKTSTSGFVTKSLGVHYLDKNKEYVLKLNINAGNGAGDGNYAYLKKITVAEKLPVIVTASESAIPAAAGETKSFTVTANYGEEPIDLTAADVSVKTEVISGAAEVSYANGTVTTKPAKNGVTTVRVSVSYSGMTGYADVNFYSMPDDDGAASYVYDFIASRPDGYIGNKPVSEIPELKNYANSILKGSAPWMYHSGGDRYSGNVIWAYDMGAAYAFTLEQRDGGLAPRQLRIFVPSDGLYDVSAQLYAQAVSTLTDYTLIPCDADGNETGDAIYVGHTDGYLANAAFRSCGGN